MYYYPGGVQYYQAGRPPQHFLNPDQVKNYLNQAVDMRMSSGRSLCNVYITYVSSQTDKEKPDYGDMTYLRIIDGKFVSFSNNTQNIDEVGPAGSLCGHRPSW
ncbi:hypothetical protein [Paenibacillus polymyxa]|uniref:Uncharacterized protein n=1 Tax=Paenibacillus polymyxa TaxID=1406 RepID=A0AAE9IBJ3_PAEPO|nr:hypothetical protein [Paenibacillus polymyxa]URJ48384.1 hypothetical protein MF626_002617 [Paenibacillus polymyxa]